MQASPLNTDPYSAASMMCPFEYQFAISNSTNFTHKRLISLSSWLFPISINGICAYSTAQILNLGQSLTHSFLLRPHSIHSKSCVSNIQNMCYIWALTTASSVIILDQTLIVSHVSVAVVF